MSRVRETETAKAHPGVTEGAGRAAFTARLQLILQHWPSTDRLARAMGVSPSAFRKWLRGEAEPSRERLIALADASRVSVAWLAKGEGPAPSFMQAEEGGGRGRASDGAAAVESGRFVLLPKQPESATASVGSSPPADTRTGYLALRHDWVRTNLGLEPTDLALETTIGESMLPTIRPGDLLLVDTTDRTVKEVGVYVLEYHGERMVKRVQRKLDGSLVLFSDNATYEPDRMEGEMLQSVTVVGRVVWRGGTV